MTFGLACCAIEMMHVSEAVSAAPVPLLWGAGTGMRCSRPRGDSVNVFGSIPRIENLLLSNHSVSLPLCRCYCDCRPPHHGMTWIASALCSEPRRVNLTS